MQGDWVRKPTNGTTVVFVHGILSSGELCWKNENGTYWPELLKDEEEFQELGIYVYSYQTGLFSGTYSLNDVVDDLKERLINLDNVVGSQKIVFVCHSMGGIVVRKLLVDRLNDFLDRAVEVGLFLVASPSLGSNSANNKLIKVLVKALEHSQAEALKFSQQNQWLNDLDTRFKNLKEDGRLKLYGKELIEDKFIILKKIFRNQVVPAFSGARYFGEPYKVPGSDHFSIAKPENKDAIQHRQLLVFLEKNKPHTGGRVDETLRLQPILDSNNNPTISEVSPLPTEIEQLRIQLEALHLDKYANKLESIKAMRGKGDIEGAWGALTTELASLADSAIPKPIQANYYYHAARWAQEDGKPIEQYCKYYETACRLDSKIDDRTYRAFELAAQKRIDEVIKTLSPLDTESIVINLFKSLIDFGRFSEINGFVDKIETPITDEILRFQALCQLASGKPEEAWEVIAPLFPKKIDSAVFQLTAGYINFWQALPSEFHSLGTISPHFFVTDILSHKDSRNLKMRDALNHLEQALTSVNSTSSKELKQGIIDAHLAVCVNLPDKHPTAIDKAKNSLMENPIAPFPILCLLQLKADYNWGRTVDVLSDACEQPFPAIWQIYIYAELLLDTNHTEQAWKLLLKVENRFATDDEKTQWLELAIRSLSLLGKLSELEQRITDLDDSVEFRRVKAGYWVRCGNSTKALGIAKDLVTSTGSRLDYINLANIHRQERMWPELTVSASQCLEQFDNAPVHIADSLAQALLALDKPKDALGILDKYKPIFERDEKLNDYHAHSMAVHSALGQYPEALEKSDLLWEEVPTEQLLIQRAQLQVAIGENSRAIEVLKEGVEQGFKTPQVLIILANYLVITDREEAFQVVKDAVELSSDDPQLLMDAMLIGFNTGHSGWASIQMAVIQQKFPDSGILHECKLPNLLEYSREYQSQSQTNWNQFIEGRMPIHLWLDSERKLLGADFYWRWHSNHAQPIFKQVPLPISYGGRPIESVLESWEGRSLTMDYSACLVAHALKLFPQLNSSFDEIYVPPSLFSVIQSEIQQQAQVQSDLFEKTEQLLQCWDTLLIKSLKFPALEVNDYSGLQMVDRVEWNLAIQNNLWIVTEQFATELFETGIIPDRLRDLQVTYADIFTILRNRGELHLEEKQFTSHTANYQKVEQLNNNKNLLVDKVFLELLIELDVLEVFSRMFNLYCIDGIHDQLKADIESYRYRQKSEKWLKNLLIELNNMRRKGKLKLLTLLRSPKERNNGNNQPLSTELEELLLGSEQTNSPVWVDDRFLNSYVNVSAQAPIVGVHDILGVLLSRNTNIGGKYIECFRSLIRNGVSCRLPPAEYILKELKQAKCDTNTGHLIENTPLANLRQSVWQAISSESILGEDAIRPELIPEKTDFLLKLHQLVDSVMIAIWIDDKFNKQQRFAMADWIYQYFLPQQGRPILWESNNNNSVQGLAIEHCFRISLAWQLMAKPNTINEYYQWLFPQIEPAWLNNQALREATLLRFSDLIISILNSSLVPGNEALSISIFTEPLRCLPSNILDELLIHPKLEPKLKKYFTGGIYFESLNLSVSEDEWLKLSEACISAEPGESVTETVKSRKITLEFKSNNGVGDKVCVSGETENGNPHKLYMLNPYGRLEHPTANKRTAWFDEIIQARLLDIDNVDNYRTNLAKDDFSRIVEDLKNQCEHSGDFFFSYASFSLEITDLSLYSWEQIIPSCTDIFLSILPNDYSAEWLFANSKDDFETRKRLASIASLPFGEPFNLSAIVKQAISSQLISVEKISEFINQLAMTSHNPIVLQNLLTIYLQITEIDGQKQAKTLITNLLTLESNNEFELYIELLHLIWSHFQLTSEFNKHDYKQLVTWAYIYADCMLTNMLKHNESDDRDYWPIASKNIKEAIVALDAKKNPFNTLSDGDVDVMLPSYASWWRTVIGGTLGVLKKNIDTLQNVQEIIADALRPLLDGCSKPRHTKLQALDFFELTDYSNNFKNSPINNQSFQIAIELVTLLSDNNQSQPELIPLRSLLLNILEKENITALSNCFWVLARFPVPSDITDILIDAIQNHTKKHSLSNESAVLFLGEAELLGRLNTERALSVRKDFIDKLLKELSSDLTVWHFIPEMIIKLYRFDEEKQRIDMFITTLKQIAEILPKNTVEFREFSSFIRNVEAYIKPDDWPILRGVL